MKFQSPYWLLAAALLTVAYVWIKRSQHRDDWHRIIPAEVLSFLRSDQFGQLQRLGALLVAAIAAIALANPSLPKSDSETYRHSEGWFVLADVSRSMTLDDIAPTRLSVMRDTALKLAAQTGSRPISLIIYAGDAFLLTPPAFDTQHFSSNVSLLEHGLVPVEGSNLTRALSLVSSVIESGNMLNSRIFILGDTGGINTKAQAAVSRLAGSGHSTDVIAIGSDNTSASAVFDLTAADDLANAGNGKLIVADQLGQVALQTLQLDRIQDTDNSLIQSGISLMRWNSLSHWVLLPAVLIMLTLFLRERA